MERGGEPDHSVPDFYDHYGLSRNDFFTVAHRLHMPFPAKYFAENICDGMHFAVAHAAAEWGEAIALVRNPNVGRHREPAAQLPPTVHLAEPAQTLPTL